MNISKLNNDLFDIIESKSKKIAYSSLNEKDNDIKIKCNNYDLIKVNIKYSSNLEKEIQEFLIEKYFDILKNKTYVETIKTIETIEINELYNIFFKQNYDNIIGNIKTINHIQQLGYRDNNKNYFDSYNIIIQNNIEDNILYFSYKKNKCVFLYDNNDILLKINDYVSFYYYFIIEKDNYLYDIKVDFRPIKQKRKNKLKLIKKT